MGILVALEDERGKQLDTVEDPRGHLFRSLPSEGGRAEKLLGYVDRYGDTVFNRLQMDAVLSELSALIADAKEPEQTLLLERIRDLASRCKREAHCYLKFYGD
jgi:hypothetical protein